MCLCYNFLCDASEICIFDEVNPLKVSSNLYTRYEGLSEKFLSSPVPKILLLAGTDRLDRFSL